MSLYIVATPIGHPKDISLRAIEILKKCPIIIGEERREVSKLLKSVQIVNKEPLLLNEHSTTTDIKSLAEKIKNTDAALVSDAGTPGFCDPGAQLVRLCRQMKIPIYPIPGASSLMALISVSGLELSEFVFKGFLPREKETREAALKNLKTETRPVVIMDTPYRLPKLMTELKTAYAKRRIIIGLDLTTSEEQILEATAQEAAEKIQDSKHNFVLILLPE